MKRNMMVKKNVDDMIYQVLNYIDHSNLPDDETEALVYEILSSIIMWNCDWDPENIDMESIGHQINRILTELAIMIPAELKRCLDRSGYRITGE